MSKYELSYTIGDKLFFTKKTEDNSWEIYLAEIINLFITESMSIHKDNNNCYEIIYKKHNPNKNIDLDPEPTDVIMVWEFCGKEELHKTQSEAIEYCMDFIEKEE